MDLKVSFRQKKGEVTEVTSEYYNQAKKNKK